MTATRFIALGAALALAAGALGACENKSSATAEPENAPVTGDGTTSTGEQLREEAAQVGDAVEAAAGEVAQEIDQTTDKMAAEAKESKADTAAEATEDNAGKR